MVEDLNSSKIGTKPYWNKIYEEELLNFFDHDDPGFEWFGKNATNRVIKWISSCGHIFENSSILDIGCGNGLLLLELAKRNFTNLTGVDYCSDALELAKAVFNTQEISIPVIWLLLDFTNQTLIRDDGNSSLKPWCIFNNLPSGHTQKTFDLCLDKGTYDAISLNPFNAREKRLLYLSNLKKILSITGIFIIVSCNWTSEELKTQFSELQFLEELKAPSFAFGGKTGQTVSTCIFKNKS